MKGVGRKLFKSKIAHNAASLYLVQACRKLIPLVTLPYLARVLGPSGWGDVAFTQSMGEFIAIFIEFGFLLSATRDLAQNRSSKRRFRANRSRDFWSPSRPCHPGCCDSIGGLDAGPTTKFAPKVIMRWHYLWCSARYVAPLAVSRSGAHGSCRVSRSLQQGCGAWRNSPICSFPE